ncbi:hypothetical protein M011DRAFT_307740 [Sporormia fimetaria CBS 119925]|uniref:Uncharacterized protein n=1 Tax=Sporormia fimetaria CBS 119925 TaxID=1340428 RepID=A0A6A6VIS2_9PLEO|nr:hypothetical protein M011DRAFT_307740 [Sporormia fimetaria CBS 119925]
MDNNDHRRRAIRPAFSSHHQPQTPPHSAAYSQASHNTTSSAAAVGQSYSGSQFIGPDVSHRFTAQGQLHRGANVALNDQSAFFGQTQVPTTAETPQYQSMSMYSTNYQQNRPSGMSMWASGPGVAQQYYTMSGSEPAPVATASGLVSQNVSNDFHPLAYTAQPPAGRDALLSSYTTRDMNEARESSQQTGYSQEAETAEQAAARKQEVMNQYQQLLLQTNGLHVNGRLQDAADNLIRLLEYVTTNAEALNLTRDDPVDPTKQKEFMLEFWRNHNNCWLATLQKQKTAMEESNMSTSQHLQSFISVATLERMGESVIRAAEVLSAFGLVDYEIGLWEEHIINMIMECEELVPDATWSSQPNVTASPGRD